MNCPNCKSQSVETDSFCMKCGFNLFEFRKEKEINNEKSCPDCSAICSKLDSACKICGYPFVVEKPQIYNDNKFDKDFKPIVPEEKSIPVSPIKIKDSFEKTQDSRGIGIKIIAIIAVLVIISCVIFFVIKYNKPLNVEVPVISSVDTSSSDISQNTSNITDHERLAAEAAAAARPVDTIAQEGEYDDDYAYNNTQIEVGSKLGEGIVAYIYTSGNRYIEGETHGFIMAPREAFSPSWNAAFKVCDTLNINGETYWTLPNKEELRIIYNNISQLGGYKSGSHGVWSSTQYNDEQAYVCSFDGGGRYYTLPKNSGFFVRAIKYF